MRRVGCKPPCNRMPVPPVQAFLQFFCRWFQTKADSILRSSGIERAERAVFGAEIRVVDVAIDLISRHARVRFLRRISIAAMRCDQVIGANRSSASCCVSPHRDSVLTLSRNLLLRCIYSADEFEFPGIADQPGAEALLKIQSSPPDFLIEANNQYSRSDIARARAAADRASATRLRNFGHVREAILTRRLEKSATISGVTVRDAPPRSPTHAWPVISRHCCTMS